jgi:hypothetical protein
MHYDFIEIGTSDFDSVVELSKENAVGICVEPVRLHLDSLPDRTSVKKVCSAISKDNRRGECRVYYMHPAIVSALGLPEWLKGCNSVNQYHPQHTKLGISHLVQVETVPEIPISDLLAENNVTSIGLLKIDTEGSDCSILMWLFADLIKSPHVAPKKIIFENNALTDKDDLAIILSLYNAFGYTETNCSGDNIELSLNS